MRVVYSCVRVELWQGRTCVHHAAMENHDKALLALATAGADLNTKDVSKVAPPNAISNKNTSMHQWPIIHPQWHTDIVPADGASGQCRALPISSTPLPGGKLFKLCT